MPQRKYRLDVCPECKVREDISSRKRVYQCSYCGRWFCKRHLEPRLVNIPDFRRIIKDVSWQNLIEKEWRKKDAHPDFQYTKERWREFRLEKELTWAKIGAFLDRSRGYGKPVSIKPPRENKCQVCGKKLELPFRCSYCQEYFCVDHKLPENHQCTGLPKEPFWYPKRRKLAEATERRVDRCPKCGSGSIGVLSFDRETANLRCRICGHEWTQPRSDRKHQKLIPKETTPYVPPKPRNHKVRNAVLVVSLWIVLLIVLALFTGLIRFSNESFSIFPPSLKTPVSPVASFIPSKTTDIFVGEEIVFNASSSYDPDNAQGKGIVTYKWDFGDGKPIKAVSSNIITYSYTLVKSYDVTLTVIDDDGQNATYTRRIEVQWYIPTTSQLRNWLALDKTNERTYSYPDFVCFDFAKMLANHSRQKNWKMALVLINGSDTSTKQSWYHAINAINTTDGLVYIEPQSDEIWWYANHAKMTSGNTYKFWDYPYQSVYVYIYNISVLHLEDLEKYQWIRP